MGSRLHCTDDDMNPLFPAVPLRFGWPLASALWLMSVTAPAADTVPVGRYLDRNLQVHEAARLHPLQAVADLTFSDRMSVGEALRSALAGTGYRLQAPGADETEVRQLLATRIAMSHLAFEGRQLDSVIAALVGDGRGFAVEIHHVTRTVRILPALQAVPSGEPG